MRSRNEELPLAVEIQRTEEKLHLYEALTQFMRNPQAMLDVLLAAADAEAARRSLKERFGLDDIQSRVVLDAQFRRTTQLERRKIDEHRQELVDHLAFLRGLDAGSP